MQPSQSRYRASYDSDMVRYATYTVPCGRAAREPRRARRAFVRSVLRSAVLPSSLPPPGVHMSTPPTANQTPIVLDSQPIMQETVGATTAWAPGVERSVHLCGGLLRMLTNPQPWRLRRSNRQAACPFAPSTAPCSALRWRSAHQQPRAPRCRRRETGDGHPSAQGPHVLSR